MSEIERQTTGEEIAVHLGTSFGWKVQECRQLNQGWLNVKWQMMTDCGPIFVKWYHPDRYKMNVPAKREHIEHTLRLQQMLHQAGVACPGVHSYENCLIHETPTGKSYAVLNWVNGNTALPGLMSELQMFELGVTTGLMHRLLQEVKWTQPAWKPNQADNLSQLQSNLDKAKAAQDHSLTALLEQAVRHVASMDFDDFSRCTPGWLHWDLWADNILVNQHGVAGIVDFDRMGVAYPIIDAARAVLSGAWHQGRFRTGAAQAFAAGYRQHGDLPEGALLNAFRLLYLIESVWWLRTDLRTHTAVRFFEELQWMTEEWTELPAIVSEVE